MVTVSPFTVLTPLQQAEALADAFNMVNQDGSIAKGCTAQTITYEHVSYTAVYREGGRVSVAQKCFKFDGLTPSAAALTDLVVTARHNAAANQADSGAEGNGP